MNWILPLLEFLNKFLPFLEKYFPKETVTEKQRETAQREQDEAALLKQTGRPKWD